MKAYMVYVTEFDFRSVYDCHYSLFKTKDAAKVAMEKEYNDKYWEYTLGKVRDNVLIGTNLDRIVVLQIAETEVEG